MSTMNSTQALITEISYNMSTPPANTMSLGSRVICFFLTLSSILLLTLNLLCLLVLRHVDNIHDTTKVFLRSMTVADLGVGIFMALPMTVTLQTQRWPFGTALCAVQSFTMFSSILGSLLSLLLLTVDRYISVVYALRYHSLVTRKRARIAVCCVWSLTVALMTGAGIISNWHTEYLPSVLMCYFSSKNDKSRIQTYFAILYIAVILLCLLTLLIAYTRLFMITRRHAQRIHTDNEIAQNGQVPGTLTKKTLHTLLLMVLAAFLFSIIPALCVSLNLDNMNSYYTFFLLALPILTNSWLNAVIYYLRNKEFRQATKALLRSYGTSFQKVIRCKFNTN
ncbi:melanocortin receptor 5-like [Acanthaster planci]|uniref:Melanocortin receptor 5-like n=1 Tax=Acanthaster planci TaxID=133434 RepID=A0A8B7YS07_ACAPL|nr:melanocortin receptor 5-like [Acanthaster planci]